MTDLYRAEWPLRKVFIWVPGTDETQARAMDGKQLELRYSHDVGLNVVYGDYWIWVYHDEAGVLEDSAIEIKDLCHKFHFAAPVHMKDYLNITMGITE